jgi:hypothetical protein
MAAVAQTLENQGMPTAGTTVPVKAPLSKKDVKHSRDANNAGTLTTPVAEDMSTALGKAKTAEAPAIEGTQGTSTVVRTTASTAKETPATA